jgi:arginyl-tRNA synthetase
MWPGCRFRREDDRRAHGNQSQKAAHIGHLRNAALGDTLVRALAFCGTPVEVQNYIDDTGVQVADVIVGFREIEHRSSTRSDISPTRRGSTITAGICIRG